MRNQQLHATIHTDTASQRKHLSYTNIQAVRQNDLYNTTGSIKQEQNAIITTLI